MTAKAEKALDLESSRQLLNTGVAYLAAVTRRVRGLREIDCAVSTPNHGGSALMAGAASALKSSPELAEAEHQQFVAMLALDDLSGQASAAEAALEAAQAETERSIV
jgi:hypothetical protein